METLIDAVVAETHVPPLVTALRLLAAAMLGAVIGFEREVKARPAGLRTHTLTALAAALFTILMLEIVHAQMSQDENVRVDPIRIIEAVTAGVAFLAAGAIIQARGRVQGLTTGAAMWLAGAVGVACGLGFLTIALMATAIGVAVAMGLQRFSHEGAVPGLDDEPASRPRRSGQPGDAR